MLKVQQSDSGKYLIYIMYIVGIRDEDTLVLWGMSRDFYAQYLMSLGHHQKARDQFKQAYDISCEVNGETDEQSLVLLNSLGKKFQGVVIYKVRLNHLTPIILFYAFYIHFYLVHCF